MNISCGPQAARGLDPTQADRWKIDPVRLLRVSISEGMTQADS